MNMTENHWLLLNKVPHKLNSLLNHTMHINRMGQNNKVMNTLKKLSFDPQLLLKNFYVCVFVIRTYHHFILFVNIQVGNDEVEQKTKAGSMRFKIIAR